MFNDNQLALLTKELDPKRVKGRSKGNVNLSYLEGFDVINFANKVFGFGNWSYEITSLTHVSEEKNQNYNSVVSYRALVKLTVYNINHTLNINREDIGFGIGTAKTLSEAHENGAKEAVTDSLKRALRSFGNQFGNSLYDKSKNHKAPQNTEHQQNHQNFNNNHQNPQCKNQENYNSSNNYSNKNTQVSNQNHDYTTLYNLGLTVVEQGVNLIVLGDDIFSKKDSIKACGFKWDGVNKIWYKKLEKVA